MKEVQINRWCDGYHGVSREPADLERTISIDGAPPRVLDLCNEHDIEMVSPLWLLLDKYGQEVPVEETKPGAPAQVGQCPLCPVKCKTRQNLSAHTRDVHGKGLRELTREGLLPPPTYGRGDS